MRELIIRDLVLVYGGQGVPGAVVGGLTAGAGYIGNAIGQGSGNMADFLVAVGGGALVGALVGPGGGTAMNTVASGILYPSLGFNTGLAGGLINRDYGSKDGSDYNKAGTNYN